MDLILSQPTELSFYADSNMVICWMQQKIIKSKKKNLKSRKSRGLSDSKGVKS